MALREINYNESYTRARNAHARTLLHRNTIIYCKILLSHICNK